MLSYRHAFHTGNHADMLKHFVLYLVLDYFNRKDKPYHYIDTHSGTGWYDLQGKFAQKINEHQHGITRLRQISNLPHLLNDFIHHIKQILPDERHYCGSPLLASSLLRQSDKMYFFELHPSDFQHLSHNVQAQNLGKRAIIKQQDGYQGLIGLLPPPTRRGVVLIDPPYGQKQDYQIVTQTMQHALKRFAQGCYLVWYPCLSRKESLDLPKKLKKLMPNNYLQTELHVHAPRADGFGMHGSGMFVFNPPYLLAEQLQHTLPTLCNVLAQDNTAHFTLDFQIQ